MRIGQELIQVQSIVMQYTARNGTPFVLRPARPQDAEGIIQSLREVAAEGIYLAAEEPRWTRKDVLAMIREMSFYPFILVVEADRKVVGHAFVQRGSLKKNQHAAGIGMLVIPGYRGIGIGTAMLEYIDSWARSHQLKKLFLSVFSSNQQALALYHKSGFLQEGIRPGQFIIDNHYVSEIVMGKPLDPILQRDDDDLKSAKTMPEEIAKTKEGEK